MCTSSPYYLYLSHVGCTCTKRHFSSNLWVPYREGSRDSLVTDPGSNCHHGNTSILDLLQPQALDLFAVKSSLPLGESKWVVSVVTRDASLLVPLALEGNGLEQTSSEEDL